MICDAMETAEEVTVCDEEAEEEAAAEEAAARWAPWAPEPLAKEAPSEEPVATFLVARAKAWQSGPPRTSCLSMQLAHVFLYFTAATTGAVTANRLEPKWLLV